MDITLNWIKAKIGIMHSLLKLEDQIANLLSFVVGAILAQGNIQIWNLNFLYAGISTISCLFGSNLINQITDIETDKINKPHRPLVSGKISINEAAVLTFIFYAAAIFFGFLAGEKIFLLSIAYCALGIMYSVKPIRLKDRLLLSNITIAIAYNCINFLIGWSIFKSTEFAPYPLIALMFVYDIIAINSKDYPDVEGDLKNGAKTLPVMLGLERALRLDFILQLLAQVVFIVLSQINVIPRYISVISTILFIGNLIIYTDVEKNRNYTRFYYMAFGMHIIIRLTIMIMFMVGYIS